VKQTPHSMRAEQSATGVLVEGLDYYIDASTKNMVFTAHFLEKRGYCCGNGCRHCPYEPAHSGRGAKKAEGKE
jgi:hypothetical protein